MVRPEDGIDGSVSMHRGRREEVVSEVGCKQGEAVLLPVVLQ